MEACTSVHHWGRWFTRGGRRVRLINPRFVPVKSIEQQDLQSLHRIRERLIVQQTSLINHARGLLAVPQGPCGPSTAPSATEQPIVERIVALRRAVGHAGMASAR